MGLFFFIGLIFIFSPILGAFTSVILLLYNHKKVYTRISFFFLALFLGIINSLKVPDSDLINYKDYFDLVETTNFQTYILIHGKEPLFFVFNFIVFHITDGSFNLYIIIFTLVSYYILFLSIHKLHQKINLSHNSFIFSIFIAFLFPNLFSLSAHLMRQFLASSISIYFLVTYSFYNKKNFLILLASILIHTTSFIFSMVLLPFFRKKLSLSKIILFALFSTIFFISIFTFADTLYIVFENLPVFSYLFKRISNVEDAWETDNLSLISFIVLLFNIIITYRASILDFSKKLLQPVLYINLLLLIFVIINYNNTEIALRFSFYAYFLFPISFYFLPNLFSKKNNLFFNKIGIMAILIIFFILFVRNLYYGTWEYINIESLAFTYG